MQQIASLMNAPCQLAIFFHLCYIKSVKATAHKVGCQISGSFEKPPSDWANYRGGFSMLGLLFVLKYERQQCQYKHAENHKILECKIHHRHHLHSLRNFGDPPRNTVVLHMYSITQNIFRQLLLLLCNLRYTNLQNATSENFS